VEAGQRCSFGAVYWGGEGKEGVVGCCVCEIMGGLEPRVEGGWRVGFGVGIGEEE
jgi:hypothetical protein